MGKIKPLKLGKSSPLLTIEDLAQKARLQENEKQELFNKLNEVEKELLSAKDELAFMRRRQEWPPEERTENSDKLFDKVSKHIDRIIIRELGGREFVRHEDIEKIKNRFNTLKGELNPTFIRDMRRLGLVDSEGNLNDSGANWIKSLS